MYHWIVNMRLQAILECFIDDVIRSQNKSKLWTTIALSKFELEKRSTAQNVPNWTGYQKFKFQFHIQISKFWQVSNLRLPFQTVCSSVEKKGRKVCSSSNSYQRNSMKFKTKMELVAAQKPILFQRFCLKNALTRAKKHVKMAKNSVCDAKSPKVINAISPNSKLRWNP